MPPERPLAEEAAELRTDVAAQRRRRRRDLAQQDTETAAFSGVLIDLAERGDRVHVTTTTGRNHAGTISEVGRDFVDIATDTARVLVRLAAVVSVELPPASDHGPTGRRPPSDRRPASTTTLADALDRLAEERTPITVRASTGDARRGELLDVGTDLLRLRLDGGARTIAYVALWSLAEASVTGSG